MHELSVGDVIKSTLLVHNLCAFQGSKMYLICKDYSLQKEARNFYYENIFTIK